MVDLLYRVPELSFYTVELVCITSKYTIGYLILFQNMKRREFHMRIIYQNKGFFMLIKKICNSMRLKEISIPKISIQIHKGIGSKENVFIRVFLHSMPQN